MRITKLSVKGLFGMFDNESPLDQESRITIINGPNGGGKTVLMQMVYSLFHYGYMFLREIPCDRLMIQYESDETLLVQCENLGQNLTIQIENGTTVEDSIVELPLVHADTVRKEAKEYFPNLEPIEWAGKSYWIQKDESRNRNSASRTGVPIEQTISLEELFDSDPEFHTRLYGEIPLWFSRIRSDTRISLIDTQRLFGAQIYGSSQSEPPQDGGLILVYGLQKVHVPFYLPAIEGIRIRFERFFQMHLAEFIHEREKSRRLNELAEKVSEVDEHEVSVLLQSAAEKTVGDLKSRDHYQEMEIFVDMLNERFLFKEFYVGMDDFGEDDYGVGSPTVDFYSEASGRPIPFNKLSSGEQHLLILYYQLLFETEPDTLVMIDEPELSMNVVWQRNFLKDLQRIIELRKFDVLIATHSPQIIHDKWDWMVPLGEKMGH